MQKKLIEFNLKQRTKKIPQFNPGDVVRVHRRIFDGKKEMTQLFEGVVLGIKGKQSASPTMTVRKVSHGVGVELVLPIYSPIVKKIEVIKKTKVKRSKMYHIRTKSAGALRMKYKDISQLIGKEEPEVVAEPVTEETVAEEPKQDKE